MARPQYALLLILIMQACCVSDPNFNMKEANISINAAGTALKQFFSELREPVIPQTLYSSLQDAMSTFLDKFFIVIIIIIVHLKFQLLTSRSLFKENCFISRNVLLLVIK